MPLHSGKLLNICSDLRSVQLASRIRALRPHRENRVLIQLLIGDIKLSDDRRESQAKLEGSSIAERAVRHHGLNYSV